jgi:hypothetical protein
MLLKPSDLLLLLQSEGLQFIGSFALGLTSFPLGFKAVLFDDSIEFCW